MEVCTNGGIGGFGGFPIDDVGGSGTTAVTTPRDNVDTGLGYNRNNDDDADLFSELYSESPDPVNLHGEENTRNNNMSVNDTDYHLFGECRSIEENDDSDDFKFSEDEIEPDELSVKSIDNESEEEECINNLVATNDHVDSSMESLLGNEIRDENTATLPSSSLTPPQVVSPILTGSNGRNNTTTPRSFLGGQLFRRTFGQLSGLSRRSDK